MKNIVIDIIGIIGFLLIIYGVFLYFGFAITCIVTGGILLIFVLVATLGVKRAV